MINQNLSLIKKSIIQAESEYHRAPHSVELLVVSKKQSVEKIREVYQAGQNKFGENYLQEALIKQQSLRDLEIEWHFIGHIQSNKTKLIAQHFDWVHSVDRFEIAEKLNRHRESKPLNICIEVNVDHEDSKSGIVPDDVLMLAKKIITLKNLHLRGLMVIPQKDHAKAAFEKTAALQKQLIDQGFLLDTLSMGMSADFRDAIAFGSTVIRIGTAIFGERI